MVDFTLSDEQKDIRQLAHDFAEKEIRPVAWDPTGTPRSRARSSTRRGRSAS